MVEYRSFYTNSRALVVGINSYSDPRFMTLGQAEADAQAFGDLLAGPPYNFQVERVIGAQATKNAILQALFNLRSREPDDRSLVYFAGHGYTLSDVKGNESGFLACADTVPEQDFTALKLDDVIDLTQHSLAKHICFIFDACFSGKALGLTRAAAAPSDKLMLRRAYQVLTAGAGDQTVSDYESMTTRMIDALRSGVLDIDGLTTANELGLYVQQAIVRDSRQNQIPQFGHIEGSQGGDFVFYLDTRVRLPGDLEEALRAPRTNARLAAVVDLIELAKGQDDVSQVARDRLADIAQKDPEGRIRAAANSYFIEQEALRQEEAARQARESVKAARRIAPPGITQHGEERPGVEAPAPAAPRPIAQASTPAPAPWAAPRETPSAAKKRAPRGGSKSRLPWILGGVGALAVLVVCGIVAATLLNGGNKPAPAPAPTLVPGEPGGVAPTAPGGSGLQPSAAPPAAASSGKIDCMGAASGDEVSILYLWQGDQGQKFKQVMQPLVDACGIVLKTESVTDETALNTRVQAGTSPDIAVVRPSQFVQYKATIFPVSDLGVNANNYADFWQRAGSVDGTWKALPIDADVKSLIWYSPDAFSADGYSVPTTWDDLDRLTEQMVTDGRIPWSMGMESSAATGWVGSDFIQNILLVTQGPGYVLGIIDGSVPYNDSGVKDAYQRYGQWASDSKYTPGGANGTLTTGFLDAIDKTFSSPPEAMMVSQATFARTEITSKYPGLEFGTGYDFFLVPGAQGVQGVADWMVAFNQSNAVKAVFAYLSSDTGGKNWAEAGFELTPNKAGLDAYNDSLLQKEAHILGEAHAFTPDIGDSIGGTFVSAEWRAIVGYLNGDDLDTLLADAASAQADALRK